MEQKTLLYIVRHGQTEWNVEERFQGHHDSPLTELGRNQAIWLGETLVNDPIDIIFSSSSKRTRHTAELIRRNRDIGIVESDELKEIHLGIWEGRRKQEIERDDPSNMDRFFRDPERFSVDGAESFRQVRERALSQLNIIMQEHVGKSVLIVTHTVVVKLLLAYFGNRPMERLWQEPYIHPACLSKVMIGKDEHEIVLQGDTSHYRDRHER